MSKMIFLCFSGKDRKTIVNSIRYHLESYGLNVWYDNHQYIIGDDKVSNYTQSIKQSPYAIVIISENFFDSPGAIEELEIICNSFKKNEIFVFPIFYKILAKNLPREYDWLSEMIYNELDERTGSLLTSNQILSKYLKDIIRDLEIREFNQAINFLFKNENSSIVTPYLSDLLSSYFEIGSANINARIAFLYCTLLILLRYLDEHDLSILKVIRKSTAYIFNSYKLNLEIDFKEIIIFEDMIIILLNIIAFPHLTRFE